MSQWWTRLAGVPIDAVGFGLLFLLCIAGALIVGAAWHFWPRWLPRKSWLAGPVRLARAVRGLRWSRIRLALRRRRRDRERRKQRIAKPAAATAAPVRDDHLPDVAAAELLSLADRYAAAGRFREAVRERLRAITRQLVDRGFITHHPEWTITELTRAAGTTAPHLHGNLDEASLIFSDIWYGEREATHGHDDRMRELARQIDAATSARRPAPAGSRRSAPPDGDVPAVPVSAGAQR